MCEAVLLEAGADVNAVNEDGRSALQLVEEEGHAKCVALLKAAGVVSSDSNMTGNHD